MTLVEQAARAASAALGVGRARFSERRQDSRARFRHARGRLAGGDKAELRRRRLGDLAGSDRHAQQHAARSSVSSAPSNR